MREYDLRYLYDGKSKPNLINEGSNKYNTIEKTEQEEVDYATILQSKMIKSGPPWGAGGVLNQNGELIRSSTVIRAFGAKYEYDLSDLVYIDEEVILLGAIPKHWGHFL